MPNRDGTGPFGTGPIGGKVFPGGGRGRGGNFQGTGGYCVCPKCKETVPHVPGTPCASIPCPKCGTMMVRGS